MPEFGIHDPVPMIDLSQTHIQLPSEIPGIIMLGIIPDIMGIIIPIPGGDADSLDFGAV